MLRLTLILLLSLLLLKGPYAQTTDGTDRGFVISFNMGYAWANGLCIPCGEKASIGGVPVDALAGYRFNHTFLAGFGPGYWTEKTITNERERWTGKPNNSRAYMMGYLYVFPFRKANLFIRGGIGYGNYFYTPDNRVPVESGDSTLSSFVNIGFSTLGGVGYLFPISKKVFLGPEAFILRTGIKDLEATTGERIRNGKASVVKGFSLKFIFLAPLND